MSNQAAAEAGLSDVIDVESDEETDPVTVRDVDTSGDRDDDGIAADAEVRQLHVALEPSTAEALPGMSLVPVRDELKGLTELAVTLAIADNTPSALKGKPAAVLAVFLTGRELGIPPMTALRNLHVIDGKVTVNPKVRAAMVRREGLGKLWPHQGPREVPCPLLAQDDHGAECPKCEGSGVVMRLCECGRGEFGDNDDEVATWHAKRGDDPFVIYSSTYTMAMARGVTVKAGQMLADKDNWKNYPERMLSWRSLGYLLDDAFPEVGTGLYSPDELGAITDEEGEPVIDVASTEVLTDKVKRERKERNKAPDEPPATPDTIATFQARIAKIREYEGAPEALGIVWSGQRPNGDTAESLPKVENLLYRQCRMAAAVLDMIEKRIQKGEFKQVESEAEIVDDGPDTDSSSGDTGDGETGDPDETPEVQETATGEDSGESTDPDPEPPALVLDVENLPTGKTPGDDLVWVEAAVTADPLSTRALIDAVAAEVQEIPTDQLTAVLKALDLSANGLNEATRRARIAARRVRLRVEKLAGLR